MNSELVGLIAAVVGNVSAVVAMGLRLRWKAARQKEHLSQMVELARALSPASRAESQDGPRGLRTSITMGRALERTDDR